MKQGWEIKKLGEVCNINYGTRVVQKKDGGTIYPVYGGGGATFKMDRYNREDCLIVSRFAMSNQCVRYVSGKFFLNDSGLTIESNESELSQSFLDKHITALNDTIYSLGKGVAQKNLDIKELRLLDIKYPRSREEQERIVAELDCLSGVIEKKREQLRELDALAQSIFYQMFGDPITNEKDWDVKKLGEVCKFSQGVQVDLPLQSTEKKSGWNRFLRIVDYKTCNTDIRYVNISNDKYFVNFDDVVVVRYGASAGFVGIEKEGILANNLFKLNHDRNKLNYKYLYYLLSTDYYKDFVKDIAFGAAMPALSFNSFKNFNIYIPPIALQQEYAEKIEAIEKQKELIKKSISEVEDLFNSRMSYYFN